mmetsp:Transcript_24435/g.82096  ORF Transcript_24435/g.82096 Transcript_24435/m.82096 type:complete len:218 (-) Transcript_24435:107-760(-)
MPGAGCVGTARCGLQMRSREQDEWMRPARGGSGWSPCTGRRAPSIRSAGPPRSGRHGHTGSSWRSATPAMVTIILPSTCIRCVVATCGSSKKKTHTPYRRPVLGSTMGMPTAAPGQPCCAVRAAVMCMLSASCFHWGCPETHTRQARSCARMRASSLSRSHGSRSGEHSTLMSPEHADLAATHSVVSPAPSGTGVQSSAWAKPTCSQMSKSKSSRLG